MSEAHSHDVPPPPPPTGLTETKPFIDYVSAAIVGLRWGLVPLYILLWVPVVSYVLWFAQEVVSFWIEFAPITHAPHILLHNRESFILWALGLIDASMVANLIVLIALGSYKNFVYDIDFSKISGIPKWFGHLDSTSLKVKMALSLIGITAVAILRMGMEYNKVFGELIVEHRADPQLVMSMMRENTAIQLAVHIAFIVTALGFTLNAKLMHHGPPAAEHH